jgi:hypothetical protein
MKPFFETLAAVSLSALLPAVAVAQDYAPPSDPSPTEPLAQSAPASGPSRPVADWEEDYDPAPSSVAAPPTAQGTPSGEWVQTEQYGWVWMPYADAYTRVPSDGYGEPYAYVYCPAYGWSWLAAPWVWGLGPWPTFGVFGAVHFGWYEHGWWRTPERWHWTGGSFHGGSAPGRGWRGGAAMPGRSNAGGLPPRGGSGFSGGAMRTNRSVYSGGGFGSRFAPGGGTRSFQGGSGGRGAFPGRSASTSRGGFGGRGSFSQGASRGGHAASGGGLARAFGGGHRSWGR